MRGSKILCTSLLVLLCTAGTVQAKANLHKRMTSSERNQIRLENDLIRLENLIEAQDKKIHDLENADAGIKNTLMCLHAYPVNPLEPGYPVESSTTGNYLQWIVTVDDYCLAEHGNRMMVPVEPPTFFPETYYHAPA